MSNPLRIHSESSPRSKAPTQMLTMLKERPSRGQLGPQQGSNRACGNREVPQVCAVLALGTPLTISQYPACMLMCMHGYTRTSRPRPLSPWPPPHHPSYPHPVPVAHARHHYRAHRTTFAQVLNAVVDFTTFAQMMADKNIGVDLGLSVAFAYPADYRVPPPQVGPVDTSSRSNSEVTGKSSSEDLQWSGK